MSSRKRVIRQRLWTGESEDDTKANARSVGENLRNVDSAVLATPAQRVIEFSNQAQPPDGYVFGQTSVPQGVLCIWAERTDGSVHTTALSSCKFDGSTMTARFAGLASGERYATVRLLVIG
jgi:hypothetical protein